MFVITFLLQEPFLPLSQITFAAGEFALCVCQVGFDVSLQVHECPILTLSGVYLLLQLKHLRLQVKHFRLLLHLLRLCFFQLLGQSLHVLI